MHNAPNFSHHYYSLGKELGHNRSGGRVTYLATDMRNQQLVVIKQFQFAKTSSSWQSYDTYEREVQLLKALNHPGIPRYLDAFQTEDGFCMVQEYKQAVALATARSFSPTAVRQIAIAALEILVYLQNRIPPVIHRDLKPENILVDAAHQVYLIDFGFARVGDGEVGVSSVVKGTLGFMPPEQLFNRQLSEASDLYGLGMSLLCLLTHTTSDRIGDLVDITYRVSFKHLVPKLNLHWVHWLEKMVEPRLKDRFPNAVAALAALPSSPVHLPTVHFSQTTVAFDVRQPGTVLTQSVMLNNPIPETLLTGQWEVAAHPHDPPQASYRWITVEPATFTSNQVTCHITVDTSRLLAGKTYDRRLLLQTNTLAKTACLHVQVQTARSPTPHYLLTYGLLGLFALFVVGLSLLTSGLALVAASMTGSLSSVTLGTLLGSALGVEGAAWLLYTSGWRFGATVSSVAALLLGGLVLAQMLSHPLETPVTSAVLLGTTLGGVSGGIAGVALSLTAEKLRQSGSAKLFAVTVPILLAITAVSSGLGGTLGLTHPLVLPPFLAASLALSLLTAYRQLKRSSLAPNAHRLPPRPIKP